MIKKIKKLKKLQHNFIIFNTIKKISSKKKKNYNIKKKKLFIFFFQFFLNFFPRNGFTSSFKFMRISRTH